MNAAPIRSRIALVNVDTIRSPWLTLGEAKTYHSPAYRNVTQPSGFVAQIRTALEVTGTQLARRMITLCSPPFVARRKTLGEVSEGSTFMPGAAIAKASGYWTDGR